MRKLLCFWGIVFAIQVVAQEDVEVINIENAAVRAYMDDRTYEENPGSWTTVVYNYRDTTLYGKNLDWPAGKKVTWVTTVPAEDLQDVIISVSENKSFANAATHYPDNKADTVFTIRNLLPHRLYYYKVEELHHDGRAKVLASGKFRTEGQVRMIQVRNSRNVRDIGGWWSQYGCPIRYGVLYRSGSLGAMNKKGRHDFAGNLKVGAELDLRYPRECPHNVSRLGEDADFIRITHEAGAKGLTKFSNVYPRDLRWIIERLREGKNVNWHCAQGCDRCGAVSFLIEGLLGMSEIDLCRDFELSSFAGYKRPRAHVKSMLDVIRRYGPKDNLAKCFYEYWRSLGMKEEELDFFIMFMLDLPEKQALQKLKEGTERKEL